VQFFTILRVRQRAPLTGTSLRLIDVLFAAAVASYAAVVASFSGRYNAFQSLDNDDADDDCDPCAANAFPVSLNDTQCSGLTAQPAEAALDVTTCRASCCAEK